MFLVSVNQAVGQIPPGLVPVITEPQIFSSQIKILFRTGLSKRKLLETSGYQGFVKWIIITRREIVGMSKGGGHFLIILAFATTLRYSSRLVIVLSLNKRQINS